MWVSFEYRVRGASTPLAWGKAQVLPTIGHTVVINGNPCLVEDVVWYLGEDDVRVILYVKPL